METKRRSWLKQVGIGVAALGLRPFNVLAEPLQHDPLSSPGNHAIKLSSNENVYGPSSAAIAAMMAHVKSSNRYGWDLTGDLLDALAKKHSLTPENILLGAGSTELLDLTARLASLNTGNFVIADTTYDYWTGTPVKLGLEKIVVKLTADKKHDLPAMLAAINDETRLVYICNPNNPTGTICDAQELAAFVHEATKRTLVMVDEAYIDFTTQRSLSDMVSNNRNLVIVKTFSKIYGLAGARIGYALGHTETLGEMAKLQSWNNGSVSVASAAAALATLNDKKFVQDTYSKNEAVRQFTVDQLQRMHLQCVPSHSNFVYFSLENYTDDYFAKLKSANILGTRIYEEQGKWTRITIGTMKEMQQFIKVIGV